MAMLYEFAVIRDEKRDKDGEVTEVAAIVVPVQTVLARDADQAQLLAARAIPSDVIDESGLDRLTVVLRPF